MAVEFDPTRRPVRPSERLALVCAVREGVLEESVWLEWKSDLDLRGKHGRMHAARAIVGFANRMPDVASPFADGHGFLLVGVERGSVPGTAWIDPVELEDGITSYAGTGPQWTAEYVALADDAGEGVQVLVVDVAAPKWGDPIRCIRKEFDNIRNGDVFVRGRGKTARPDADGIAQLSARLTRSTDRAVQVTLAAASGMPLPTLDTSDAAVSAWLLAEKQTLLTPLEASSGGPAVRTGGWRTRTGPLTVGELLALVQETRRIPDPRSPEHFRTEVAMYLNKARAAVPTAVRAAGAARIAPLVLELTNPTPANLSRVQVRLDVPGNVEAVLTAEKPGDTPKEALPTRPTPYGPRLAPDPLAIDVARFLPTPVSAQNATGLPTPRPVIRNGGTTAVSFPAVDLRPHETVALDGVVLLVQAPAPTVIEAT